MRNVFLTIILSIVLLPAGAFAASWADTIGTGGSSFYNQTTVNQTTGATLSTPGATVGVPGTVEGYVPLEPLTPYGQYRDFGDYLSTMYQLVVTIGALIAVVMLVTGGVRYMLSEGFTDIDKAKLRIRSALTGLLVLVGSFLILYTINPNLLKFNLLIPPLKNQGASGFNIPTSNETAQAQYRKIQDQMNDAQRKDDNGAESCNAAIQWLKENGAYTGGVVVPTNKMNALGCGATYAKNRSANFEECTNLKKELSLNAAMAYSNGCANYR